MALATAIGAILPKNFVGWSRRYEHNYNFIQGLAGGLRMVDAPEDVEPNLFALMLEEAKKFSALIGVADSTILEIYTCPTDWEFILKMDALLETAVRKLVKVALTGSELIDNNKLEAFVDALPMRGRSSLIELLKATQCGESEIALIDCVRRLRNGFAHDIVQINSTPIEVIKKRNDKSVLIKGLSYIEKYNEADLIKSYEKDGGFLRFGIVHGALIFMIAAYQNATDQEA